MGKEIKISPFQKLPIDKLLKLCYNNYSKKKGNDTMKTLLIVCAMLLTGGAVTRFVASIDRKKPSLGLMFWSGLEIIALAILFNFFTIGA